MIKKSTKLLITATLASVLLAGCNQYEESLKILPNEIAQSNQCISNNKEFETDCYDLIAYKNSIALLRLGIKEFAKGNHKEAFNLYTLAQKRGNFYANSLLADLYFKGNGVKENKLKGLELLEDVEEVDPIAAYKLSFHYMNKKEYEDAVKLLTFASKNNVKDAQLKLSEVYAEGKLVKEDKIKSEELKEAYLNKKNSFITRIYGI